MRETDIMKVFVKTLICTLCVMAVIAFFAHTVKADTDWQTLTKNAEFGARLNSGRIMSIGGTAYIIGGNNGSSELCTGYKSNNGMVWTSFNIPFCGYSLAVTKTSTLYVAQTGSQYIYSSTNGSVWLTQTTKAFNGLGTFSGLAIMNNAFYGISGKTVVKSFDGADWFLLTRNAEKSTYGDIVTFNDKLYSIGFGTSAKEVYNSSDGISWTCNTKNAEYDNYDVFNAVVYSNKIWLIGGQNGGTAKKDVWYSSNGTSWTKTNDYPEARMGVMPGVINGKLIAAGGSNSNGTFKDVYLYVPLTATITPSNTNTPVLTKTITLTLTNTPMRTLTSTITKTITLTPTRTQTPTRTITKTITVTSTFTVTPTITHTPINTSTVTLTSTNTPNSTATVTPTVTLIPTPFLKYLGTNTSGYKNNITIEWRNVADYYVLYYGLAGEFTEIITQDMNYSPASGRFVYELQNLQYEGIYNVTVTAESDIIVTPIVSNPIQIKPKASPTP